MKEFQMAEMYLQKAAETLKSGPQHGQEFEQNRAAMEAARQGVADASGAKSKSGASFKPLISPTYTVRPTKELLPKLQRIAIETGKSEGIILQESATAIIEMVDKGYDFVPSLVQRVRLIREFTPNETEGMLGGGVIPDVDQNQIRASETVRNLSPDLTFLPIYSDLPHWSKENDAVWGAPQCEQIGIPYTKEAGACFGVKVGAQMEVLGSAYLPGDILLMATFDSHQSYLNRERKTEDEISPELYLKRLLTSKTSAFCNRLETRGIMVAGWHAQHSFVGFVPWHSHHQSKQNSIKIQVSRSRCNRDEIVVPFTECKQVFLLVHEILVPRDLPQQS